MQQGLISRISRSSIMEYHAFGIVSYVFGGMSPMEVVSLTGAAMFCQGGTSREVPLPDLRSTGRLYPLVGQRPSHTSLDAAVEGAHSCRPVEAGYLTNCDIQFAGVSHSSTMYKRGIRVCTGTGLGAALSTCLQVRCGSYRATQCATSNLITPAES